MLCDGFGKVADELLIGLSVFGPLVMITFGLYASCVTLRLLRERKRHSLCYRFAGTRRPAPLAPVAEPILSAARGIARRNCYASGRSWADRKWR